MIVTPKIGQIFRVRIQLHYTWIIAFILAAAIVVTQFSEAYPLWQRVLLGIAAGLLFLLSISIREFILRLLAVSKGIPVRRITLYILGGVPKLSTEIVSPSIDLLVAVAGLATNIFIVVLLWSAYLLLMTAGSVTIAGLIQWLAYFYFLLMIFHFIPGFPLDAGRILRAILWKTTDDYNRATRITSWIGWGIGLIFFIGGILLTIYTQQWFTGLLIVLTGWVMLSAATMSLRQAVLNEALQQTTASDMMSKEYPVVTQQTTITQLVKDKIMVTGRRYFIVAEDTELQGTVTIKEIKSISKERWDSTAVESIMTPASKVRTAHLYQSAANLLEQMDDAGIDYMPVLEDGAITGIVSRDSLESLGRTRRELEV